MKVILVGYNHKERSLFKSFFLKERFDVIEFYDHFWRFEVQWRKILRIGGDELDLKNMYAEVDVVMDLPALFFWRELCNVFPKAKIILTKNSFDECFDDWYKYIQSKKQSRIFYLMQLFSKTGWKFLSFKKNEPPNRETHGFREIELWTCELTDQKQYLYGVDYERASLTLFCILMLFGFFNSNLSFSHLEKSLPVNKMLLRQKFRQHYADILQNAPQDRTLEYDVVEDWNSFREFLGIEIKEESFSRRDSVEERSVEHPVISQIKKEAIISCVVLVSVTVVSSCYLIQNWRSIQHAFATSVIKLWYRSL